MPLINSPLITPGKYDFSYNQEYLLTKLRILDVYRAIFWGFWIFLFLGLLFWWIIKIIRKINRNEQAAQNQSITEAAEKEKHDAFAEFHEICRLIYEDSYVFRRPDSMIEQMYYPRLREILVEMGKSQSIMKKHYRHLIPDYEFYRKKLIENEINNGK